MQYAVSYILYAGTKIVDADDAAHAAELVEGMDESELMDGGQILGLIVQSVAEVVGMPGEPLP